MSWPMTSNKDDNNSNAVSDTKLDREKDFLLQLGKVWLFLLFLNYS